MDIPLMALWFVCGLGTAVFAAVARRTGSSLLVGAAGFALGFWWSRQPFAPATAPVAVAAGLLAALHLFRPGERRYTMAAAGVLAGLWTAALELQGLPRLITIPAAAGVPVLAAYLRARHPAFAPAALRDEALLFIILLAAVTGAAPGIAEGWRAAGTLNVQPPTPDTAPLSAMPTWTVVTASAALVTGGLFSLWSRR